MKTIKELRQEGWRVRCSHYRYPTKHSPLTPIKEMKDEDGKYFLDPEPRGGKIVVECRSPEGEEYVGESVCSQNDPFNKKYGRDLAMHRAFEKKRETKFKVGDKVWTLFLYHAVEVEISQVIKRMYSDPSTQTIRIVDEYRFTDDDLDFFLQGAPIFATKQELINSI